MSQASHGQSGTDISRVSQATKLTRWWFQFFFMFIPYLGKWSNLTHIFQMGWFNHQLVLVCLLSRSSPLQLAGEKEVARGAGVEMFLWLVEMLGAFRVANCWWGVGCFPPTSWLGGGFKHFLFLTLPGEMTSIFQMGWNHQPVEDVVFLFLVHTRSQKLAGDSLWPFLSPRWRSRFAFEFGSLI